jgi:hypothetical protein
MTSKITVRAKHENGPAVTGSKAAGIVASGGRVVAVSSDGYKATVDGGGYVHGAGSGRPVRVESPSYGPLSSGHADLLAQVIKAAVTVARLAEQGVSLSFASPPPWAVTELDTLGEWSPEMVSYWAASRYGNGDVDTVAAWRYAITRAAEAEDGVIL